MWFGIVRFGALGSGIVRSGRRSLAITSIVICAALLWSARAEASCTCQCVDGEMQPLCSGAIDLPPICPPTICPLAPSSIAPINPPVLPPLGTSACRQARVCDQSGNCRWQQVCR